LVQSAPTEDQTDASHNSPKDDEILEVGKSGLRLRPPHNLVPMNLPSKSTPVYYYNYNPSPSPLPPASAPVIIAPPRYYDPYAAPPSTGIHQLTPADDRIFSKFAVVPPLFPKFPFWGPHGYFNLCPKTTPGDPVWSWGCIDDEPIVPVSVDYNSQQQQQRPLPPPQYQAPNMNPYYGNLPVPAASSTYNAYALPPTASSTYNAYAAPPTASSTYNAYAAPGGATDPNLLFLQQLANQYAQNPSTGYTNNGFYNFGGGTYAPVPNTGAFMSSAIYSSATAPGRIYNYGQGALRNLNNRNKKQKKKKTKAKPKVMKPVVKVEEEEEEEVEEYVAELDEE